jgi:hypothetical protein
MRFALKKVESSFICETVSAKLLAEDAQENGSFGFRNPWQLPNRRSPGIPRAKVRYLRARVICPKWYDMWLIRLSRTANRFRVGSLA